MKRSLIVLAGLAAMVPLQPVLACPPVPPGWVPPAEEQLLSRSLSGTTDIVYGVMVQSADKAGEPGLFKVIHVYRGTAKKGDLLRAPPGWGHPTPYCAGMMGAPHAKPVGAYGVIAFKRGEPVIDFIEPKHVQIMIREGWIKSARAR
jgi:hypothetical protein